MVLVGLCWLNDGGSRSSIDSCRFYTRVSRSAAGPWRALIGCQTVLGFSRSSSQPCIILLGPVHVNQRV